MPLTKNTPRWLAALAIMLITAACNAWLLSVTGDRTLFLPFYASIIAIGFASGLAPGLLALALAEAASVLLWLRHGGEPPTNLAAYLLWLRIPVSGGLALAAAALARRYVLAWRQTRAQLDTALACARDAEQRFQLALKGSPVIAWSCDAERRYTWVYSQSANISPERFVGKTVEEVLPRAQYPEYAAAVDRVFASGQGERLPLAYLYDGETRHYVANIDPVFDAAGRVVGLIGASTDLTDIRRAEEAARTSERQLRTISDALPVLISYVDRDSRYRFNNAAYEHWFGRPTEQIRGAHVSEVVGAEAYQVLRPHLERSLAGQHVQVEVRMPRRDGLKDVAITYVPLKRDGETLGVIVLADDVTARKQAEAALREKERHWRTMFDAQPECVTVVAPDGTLIDINPAGLTLLEAQSIEQLRGQTIFNCIEPATLEHYKELHDAALADQPLQEPREFQAVGMAGTHRLMESRAVPLHDEAGQVVAVLSVTRDIGERRQAELALREADQRKDEFLATLAHELRNPMAPIRYAAATLRPGVPESTIRHARDVIERQSAQMSRLLDELLDMSRVTRNVVELKRETLDLRDLVAEASSMARPLLANLQHRLIVSNPPNPLWVNGDSTRLLQVIGNLIDNAAKYTDPGGSIELRLESGGGYAQVHIIDNGVGLSPEMTTKVFDLFSQVHKSLSKGGLGIGLNVVKRMVELHGGNIEVSSPGLGRGSCFSVRLPLMADADLLSNQAVAPENVVSLFKTSTHILIVDDNRDAAETLAQILRLQDFAVSVAFDATSALASIERARPSVILLDMGLPDMDGLEVARRVRAASNAEPVQIIAVTGWGQEADRERSREAGVDLHLVKPVDPDDLLRVLSQRLGDPGRPRSSEARH